MLKKIQATKLQRMFWLVKPARPNKLKGRAMHALLIPTTQLLLLDQAVEFFTQ